VTGARAGASGQCNCEAKYQKFFGEFKDRLDSDHKDELESALRLQEDKVSALIGSCRGNKAPDWLAGWNETVHM
jgi:hypothetical protein